MMMKQGDVVEVYHDPFTEKELEGYAKLISFDNIIRVGPHTALENWEVRFLADGSSGTVYNRSIKI